MGLFSDYLSSIKISDLKPINKVIKEADVDGVDQNQGAETSEDYTTDTGNTDQTTDTSAEEQTAENNENNSDTENQDDDNQNDDVDDQSTDYTEEDIGGDLGEDSPDMPGEDRGNDNSSSGSDSNSDEEAKVDELKKQEEELYANLTPEQLDLRHRELKEQYMSMYDVIISILDRINEANVDEEKIEAVKYISDTLETLKTMIVDYMKYSYKTKSYIENSINYNRFLAVLNGMNKILEEINKTENN